MTDVVYDFITNGIDMMVTAAVLSVVVILLRSSTTLTSLSNDQQANADRVNYYRTFNAYDNNIITGADAVGCILKFRGEVEVVVQNKNGQYLVVETDGTIKVYDSIAATSYATISGDSTLSKLQEFCGTSNNYKSVIFEDSKKSTKNGDWGDTGASEYYQGGVLSGIRMTYTP